MTNRIAPPPPASLADLENQYEAAADAELSAWQALHSPPPPRVAPPPPTSGVPPLELLRAGQRVPVAWGHSTVLPDMDFEGFSAAGFDWDEVSQKFKAPLGATKKGLPSIGAAKYAEDPTTEVLCLAYDLKNGTGRHMWLPGMPLPADLIDHLAQFDPAAPPSYAQSGLVETHNSMFEFRIWCKVLHERWGWPAINLRQMRCSMAKARAFSLPGALGNLAEVLRVPIGKDKDGKKQLERFSWPRNPTKTDKRTRITCAEDPDNAAKLYSYCDQDIVAEAGASVRMPDLIPQELEYWLADQACNWRGVGVDLTSVHACIAVLQQAHEKYNAELYKITDGFVARASEISKLQEWVSDCTGYRMSSGDTEAVEETIKWLTKKINDSGNDGCAIADYAPVIRALEIRNLIGSAAVKKVYAMARMATRDSRLCDLFIYHGARTGRDSHADVQPGNLPKSGPRLRWCTNVGCGKPYAIHSEACPWCGASSAFSEEKEGGIWLADAVDHALQIMKVGNLELVEYFFGDAVLTISGCVRGLLTAKPGHKLLCSDYSSIEAVVTATLSGEPWRIAAFENRQDIYLHGAAAITGHTYEWYMENGGKKHPDRQKIGKVSELACLGPETQVLTDRGYLAITDVLLTDLLWDGAEWVKHKGLVSRGRKNVVNLDGLRITPDHLVNMKDSWQEAGSLMKNEKALCLALANGSENLPLPQVSFRTKEKAGLLELPATAVRRLIRSLWGLFYPAKQIDVKNAKDLIKLSSSKSTRTLISERVSVNSPSLGRVFEPVLLDPSQCNVPAGQMLTPLPWQTCLKVQVLAAINALRLPPLLIEKCFTAMPMQWKTMSTEDVCLTASRLPALAAITSMRGNFMTMAAEALKSGNLGVTTEKSFFDTFRPALGGITQIWKWTVKTMIKVMSRGISDSYQSGKIIPTAEASEICKIESSNLSDVYDIAHAGPRSRFTVRTDSGHLIVHNCGFGGWVGSWRNFDKSDAYTDEEVKQKIIAFREASPMIVELWGGQVRGKPWRPERFELYGLEGMAIAAIQNPGSTYEYRGTEFQVIDDILFMKLLSGRRLTYHSPRLERTEKFKGVQTLAITFMTWNSNPAMGAMGWTRMETWGSRLCENLVQATARDVMSHAVVKLEAAGYPVVLRVHDELACEVPDPGPLSPDELKAYISRFEGIMADLPEWAKGWPIRAAGGWLEDRYRKD